MRIAVIGGGHIGGGLARAWARRGHAIALAVRDPDDPDVRALAADTGATVGSIAEAVAGADVVALAVPAAAIPDVVAAAAGFAGQIVLDCANAIAPGPSLRWGHTGSAAEELARLAPAARVFKAFNTQGAENLADPVYDGAPAAGLFCGDDDAARPVVAGLIADVGFEPVDAGPLANARLLEPMTLVWFAASKALGTRELGFRVLRR